MPDTRTASSNTKSKEMDAIQLLTADHKEVKAMFKEFESLKEKEDADDEKGDLVQRICTALTIHATVEEEIFYPAVREAIDDEDLMDEADVEHACAKDLIAQLEEASPGDDHYDAKVTVLGELVDHHVKEEEGEMFPKAKKAIDAVAVGVELAERKAELQAEMGVAEQIPDAAQGARLSASKRSGEKAKARRTN
jgi:hemerythrin-like domain-containing protein